MEASKSLHVASLWSENLINYIRVKTEIRLEKYYNKSSNN